MDLLENEDKESILTLEDFPFICRICCTRCADLKLFEEEGFLIDIFQAISKIDVRSRIDLPKNICNECINKLQDISLFIDILKSSSGSFEENIKVKKEIECADDIDSGMSRDSTRTEEYEENVSIQEFQLCRICLLPLSSFTPFEEKTHLIQLLMNIINIGVKTEFNTSNINGICNNCNNKLENISLFVFSSLYNDEKLENVKRTNRAIKIENCSNSDDTEISPCQEFDLKTFIDRNEEVGDNTPEENLFFSESKVKLENIDIKEEIIVSELAASTDPEYRNGWKIHSQTCPEEIATDGSSFPHLRNLHDSSDLTTQSDKEAIKCYACEKSFDMKGQLKQHMLTHTDERPFECDCCKKSFRSKGHLRQHMVTHTGERPFKCGCCEKRFPDKGSLKRHMVSHTGDKPFQCDCCEKCFGMRRNLQHHMLTHTGEKPFACDCCQKRFSLQGNLKRHLLTHTGDRPFKCDCCEKRFSAKGTLKQHMVTHTGDRRFKCDRCEKSYWLTSHLRQHMLSHTGERPFKCDRCEKRFFGTRTLKRHMLTHTGDRPFKCDCCEKSFGMKSDLQRHMLIHTGRKPFECYYCKKRFASKGNLKQHMVTHIPDITSEYPMDVHFMSNSGQDIPGNGQP